MLKKYHYLLLVLIFLGACGKKSVLRKYYILDFPVQPDTVYEKTSLTNYVCEISTAKMPPAYGQHRIAIRQRSHEISYFQYHQWAMAPSEILTNLIERKIQNSHVFSSASRYIWEVIPNYQISSSVYQIEVVENDDEYYAHLSMRLNLNDPAEKTIPVTYSFDRMEPLEERDLNLFATKLSSILQEELNTFVDKLKMYFLNK